MSKDTIKVNMNVYDIPILVEQLKKLETENKQLKEEIEKLNKQLNCKERLTKIMPPDTEFIILSKSDYERQEKDIEEIALELRDKIDKAIEYINNKDNWYVDVGIITKVYIEKEKLLEILGDKE